jgi:hypothetical protein
MLSKGFDMKIKGLAAIASLVLAAPAMAVTCNGSADFGDMGPPGVNVFCNIFSSAVGSFTDSYTFNLTARADSFGGTVSWDTPQYDINVSSVSLYSGATLIGSDSTPDQFNFGNLAAGSYRLDVTGAVTGQSGLLPASVGYVGGISTIAAAVPEPESVAMLLAGFFGVTSVALRRKKA